MKKLLHFLLLFFVIGISNAQTPIYKFDFDGNTNNSGSASVTTPFSSLATLIYVADRAGVANKALQLTAANFSAAVCPSLPLGSASRTLNVWAKFNNTQSTFYIMGYGTNSANNAFGINQLGDNTQFYNWGSANEVNVPNFYNTTSWYMLTFVYDGTTAKHYINGVLSSSVVKSINTLAPGGINKLSLGKLSNDSSIGVGNFSIDDASIFNIALTDAQVSNLYLSAVLPTISNVSVSSLIHEDANISYTVNAGGASTTTTVLYGQTAAANELAATGTTATGTTNTACSATTQYNSTPNAAPAGTTIYYRVQASNSVGDFFSPTFTYTQVTKPTYIVDAPVSISATSAVVNYNLNPCGGNTTSVLKYGTALGNYPITVTGFSATGFTPNYNGVTISGLLPNTTYYFVVEGTNQYGTSQSSLGLFTTQGAAPTLTGGTISNVAQTTATVNFSLNSGGSSVPTVVNYGTSSSNLNLSTAGPTVNNNVATPFTVNLTGLTANTTYYYNVVATSNGATAATGVNSFTTLANAPLPNPVYNFEFNNNLQSQDGSITLNDPIFGTTAFSYVSNGTVSNGAIQINDARSQTQLPNLPQGAANRSVHVRLRFASGALSTENFIFNWGTGATGQAFAYHQTATSAKLLGWGGAGYDYTSIPSSNANFGQWYEYVFTYNGTIMSVYRDGTLLGTSNATLNTSGDTFRIGISNSGITKLQADIDYIRVFNQALTGAQVSQIYSNPNLLSNNDFQSNLKFNLYPNPASNILNIDIESDLKSVEIYSLQGQKVFSGSNKQINISGLSSGMYMARVQDEKGSFAVQKLIKE